MSEGDRKVMKQYNITSESKLIYSYKQHRYEKLKDAVNFARLDSDITNAKESNSDVPVVK